MKPTELRTERLLLRSFRDEDAADVLAYADDAEWSHFLYDIPQPYSLQDAEQMVGKARNTDWNQYLIFAVEFEEHVIGRISADISERHERAELGWGIARAHWGQGIAHEAVSALIDFLFSTYQLPRVFARADGGNERSCRLMESLGMQREALLRSHRVGPDGRSDEVFCGLLREEWEASKR